MRSRDMGTTMNDLRRQEMGDMGYDVCRRGRRESHPGILGEVILVMSGPGRMMYQCLEPKPEGAICRKRSTPQDDYSSPHDTEASIANWPASNIRGWPDRQDEAPHAERLADSRPE